METLERNIESVLIANRGEIASRIIRTCKKMGVISYALFSDADRNHPYVGEADYAINIGDSNPTNSYLNQDKILKICKEYAIDSIHPGYGFLSENATFATACAKANIVFIGPNPEAISEMGSKSRAKAIMSKHNVPIVPGYQGNDQSNDTLVSEANKIGYPLLLKASAGGGGKGMRIVNNEKELPNAIQSAQREAINAFGNAELIIEKYIAKGRHIEFQIFGDKHGNVIHLMERECTIQRRYQKIMEESPSPFLSAKIRHEMGEAAVLAAKALEYDNAGTVEFILDVDSGKYYFLEVNTRLQVEHPVTEEITGLDLVQMQIESAEGKPLAIKQEDVKAEGYALELRLYAEDPANNYMPCTGTVKKFKFPNVDGLRVETAITSGTEVSVFYDPMIAKIIVWDENRPAAHRKMKYVLDNLVCLGITSNQQFLRSLLSNPDIAKGNYDIHFLKDHFEASYTDELAEDKIPIIASAACLAFWNDRKKSKSILNGLTSGWRNNFYMPQEDLYEIDGALHKIGYRDYGSHITIHHKNFEVDSILLGNLDEQLRVQIDGVVHSFDYKLEGYMLYLHNRSIGNRSVVLQPRFTIATEDISPGAYIAPMPSQVVKVMVAVDDEVNEGEPLIVLSSMKMENTIVASESGVVEQVLVDEGMNIPAGELLIKIKTTDDEAV